MIDFFKKKSAGQKGVINILFVDEAVAFGGSLIVLKNIVDNIDHSIFRPVIVTGVDLNKIQLRFAQDVTLIKLDPLVSYDKRFNIVKKMKGLFPPFLVKFGLVCCIILFSISRLLNTVNLVRIIRKYQIGIVHTNNCQDALVAGVLSRRKTVRHLHGVNLCGYGLFDKFILGKADKIIAISSFIKGKAVSRGYKKERISLIYNALARKKKVKRLKEDVLSTHGITAKVIIGLFGRIVDWKGHLEFLKALCLIKDCLSDIAVIIVGDSSDADDVYFHDIKRFIHKNGIVSKVIFVGFTPDVDDYYNACDIFVHSSIKPEPFGMVIIEAMSHNLPVIVSDKGAPKEFVENGVDGFVVDPFDFDAVALCLRKLVNDSSLRKKMGKRGKEKVLSNFNSPQYVKTIESLYKKLIY